MAARKRKDVLKFSTRENGARFVMISGEGKTPGWYATSWASRLCAAFRRVLDRELIEFGLIELVVMETNQPL